MGKGAGLGEGRGFNGRFPLCSGDGGGVGRGRREEGLVGAGEEDELGGVGKACELLEESGSYAADAWGE